MPAPHTVVAIPAHRRTALRFLRQMLLPAVFAIGIPLTLVVLLIVLFAADPETRCAAGLATPATDAPTSPAAGPTPRQRELFSQPLQLRPGEWVTVGATYYAAGDGTGTGTGTRGAIPDPAESDLTRRPDTFAELSLRTTNAGINFETANALGRLPWMTALRVRYRGRNIVVRKRDIGYGQGAQTIDGERYRIDLWGPAAEQLGTTSSLVRIQLVPPTGAGNTLAQSPDPALSGALDDCTPAPAGGGSGPLPLVPGDRARILPSGLAAAPEHAPAAIKQLIAAGNEIVGKPYLYGAGHGFPNSRIAPAYDCSSSITHLLYGAGLIDVGATPPSGELAATFGRPGYGEWVSLLANADHVYAYIAGLRWDTHRYGPNDRGVAGIGWHTAQRPDIGFTPRHPPGL